MADPTIVPQSRSEQILRATIDGAPYDEPAQSRIEYLLKELKEAIEAGGGGGGTTNYNLLSNKPSINGEVLTGNKTSAALIPIDENTMEYLQNGKLSAKTGSIAREKFLDHKKVGQANPQEYMTSPLDMPMRSGLLYEITLYDGTEVTTQYFAWTKPETYIFSYGDNYRLRVTETTAGLSYYGGSYRDIYCDIVSVGVLTDYDTLSNRPQINGVTLTGDKSASDLGINEGEPLTTEQLNSLLANFD